RYFTVWFPAFGQFLTDLGGAERRFLPGQNTPAGRLKGFIFWVLAEAREAPGRRAFAAVVQNARPGEYHHRDKPEQVIDPIPAVGILQVISTHNPHKFGVRVLFYQA